MSPSLRRPRTLLALAAAAAALVLLVVVLSSGSDDEIGIVRGAPAAGFPLRGDLAGDDAKIRAAVDSWARRERRDGGDFAGDDSDGVTVLWAGRTEPGTDTVVLAADLDAAILTRSDAGDDDYWQVSDATIGSAQTPLVVAGDDGVLLREGEPSVFRPAGPQAVNARAVRHTAGFWHRRGSGLPDGAVLLPGGLRTRTEPRPDPAAVFTGEGAAVRTLSPELLRRLQSGPEAARGPAALRLLAAARVAGSTERDGREQRGAGDRYTPQDAPGLDLVADVPLAPLGPVLVLGVQDRGRDRRSLVAATGDEAVANGTGPTGVRLGGSEPESGREPGVGVRSLTGPAFGAAYVRGTPDGSAEDDAADGTTDPSEEDADEPGFLLVAGDDDVTRIEVLAGRRTVRRTGAVALVPVTWVGEDENGRAVRNADVAILGRAANGTLVVPPGVGTSTPPTG